MDESIFKILEETDFQSEVERNRMYAANNNKQKNSEHFFEDPHLAVNKSFAEIDGINLVMTLTSKSSLPTSIPQRHHHIEQHILKQVSKPSFTRHIAATAAVVAVAQQQHNLSSFQHLQNLQNQHTNHNSFYNNTHSTPFSVTDILSPIEDPYRKLEVSGNPPSPYRSNSTGSSLNSPSALCQSTMASPYTMGSIYHSPGVQSYCGPTENLSLTGHYSDMRTTSWYGTTANDPRFASE